jgi:hypothetical protein
MNALDKSCGCSQCSGGDAEDAMFYSGGFAHANRMDSCSSESRGLLADDLDFDDDLDLDDDLDYDDDYDDLDFDDDYGDLDLDDDFDLDDDLDFDDLDNKIKSPCRAIRSIKVRKDQAGNRPFSDAQQAHLCDAAQIALRATNLAKQAIDGIWDQSGRRKRRKRKDAWTRDSRFTTWFGTGTLTQPQIRAVRRRIGRLRRYLDKGAKFIVIQHQDGRRSWRCPANAYTPTAGRIRVCPTGLSQDARTLARTILHELVHWLGWGHARLPGFGVVELTWDADHQQAARDLASRFPRRARRNSVNYAMFFMEFV